MASVDMSNPILELSQRIRGEFGLTDRPKLKPYRSKIDHVVASYNKWVASLHWFHPTPSEPPKQDEEGFEDILRSLQEIYPLIIELNTIEPENASRVQRVVSKVMHPSSESERAYIERLLARMASHIEEFKKYSRDLYQARESKKIQQARESYMQKHQETQKTTST